MNWKIVCEVGLKVLAAAVAGVAIFIGVDKATKVKQNPQPVGDPQQPNPTGMNMDPGQQQPQQQPAQPQDQTTGDRIIGGFRATQDTFGKMLAFVQSLTLVAENLTRIFGNNNAQPGYYPGGWGSQPYYNDPWSMRQPVNTGGGQQWTRISPFIIEAGPGPSPRGYQNYPF